MLSQYGVQSKPNIAAGAVVSPVNGKEYDIALSPLFWVRGGYVSPGNTATPFWSAGNSGRYWSSRSWSDTSYAYYLSFSTSVNPSYSNSRYYGRSLGCRVPTT